MTLEYSNKKNLNLILEETEKALFSSELIIDKNLIIKGDNLNCMKSLLDFYTGKVDLIYIDPPFGTNLNFTIGEERVSTISSRKQDDIAYSDKLTDDDYLEFIRERLIFLYKLLSDKGSIYLHIDYKIGHYIKILMDEIFGKKNFKCDISRVKCNPKNFQRKSYGNIKDMILFYTKSHNHIWNETLIDMSSEQINRLYNKTYKDGRKYTTNPLHAPGETYNGKSGQAWMGIMPPEGRHWRCSPDILDQLEEDGLIEWSKNGVPRKVIFADDYGKSKLQDIWDFKDTQRPSYPTEKNLEMLKNIIKTSSNEGGFVLDCFCGSGSTLLAAAQLNRKWIGIDSSDKAVTVTRKRFDEIESISSDYYKYIYLEQI